MKKKSDNEYITIRGARQNNLKNIGIDIPLNAMTVITGVSGSGKSSLAFDTVYAEGQRRYVATFSSYARQFLDRMDRPQVDAIDGIPPAIAIDQTNPVRTSRSTVGTMTELADHLKLLFSRASTLYCRKCGERVDEDNPESIYRKLLQRRERDAAFREMVVTFPAAIPDNFSREELLAHLAAAGYHRIAFESGNRLDVVQDRVHFTPDNHGRIIEDFEAALRHGGGLLSVFPAGDGGDTQKRIGFSSGFHCAACDIYYAKATANHFSFNSPVGACETCRGFGRVIGIDEALVVPDGGRSLRGGAIKPFQSPSYRECRDDLMRFARQRGIGTDVPWNNLNDDERRWVFSGEGSWEDGVWYGVNRFFDWLESRSYRMHVRVQLSRYRAYRQCPTCNGARLKPDALLWRIGEDRKLNIHEIMRLSLDDCRAFFASLRLSPPFDGAAEIVLGEILARLRYLTDIGLGYLTLDRQSRTLSGGEVQRINLTTALGTSLVNTLFILDEPSIGLHSRDINRLIGILHRLRDAGNTLLVVEHDPELIRAADRLIDMGPGPGVRGGAVVFSGDLRALRHAEHSLTADYLSGRKTVVSPDRNRPPPADGFIDIIGASEHNLKNIDVRLPLGRMIGIAGVSGSGKSTLIGEILYRGICRLKGKPVETPGAHCEIRGHERITGIVMVDQSAPGKTARSNPASYIGAFDPIRKLFAATRLARERGYTASTFSFNGGHGRCPTCNGAGFELVEMQFLSDVYLTCPDCHGKRFRREVLEVRIGDRDDDAGLPESKSIDEVLAMTVDEAFAFFSAYPRITGLLEPLAAVGLSYLPLGQPLPTLSGGEAQRLKLAAHLASRKAAGRTLFLFDEPTTGLHFADIAILLTAFGRLIDAGHSVIIIEHNLDVLAAVDWLIDLGPEGGDKGGEVVFAGTPGECMKCASSRTGKALRAFTSSATTGFHESPARYGTNAPSAACAGSNRMIITGAREHNLKAIDVTIPRDRFTVITGVSGSGKSTLAFDLLFAEGQRRYLESLNAYARQFVQPPPRPEVDRISGIPPTVAIEQRTSGGGRKSTVATVTEIYHYIRLLFVKLGTQFCPQCNVPVGVRNPEAICDSLKKKGKNASVTLLAPLVVNRKGIYMDLAQWASTHGHEVLHVDGAPVRTDAWPKLDRYREHMIELPVDTLSVTATSGRKLRRAVARSLELGKGTMHAVIDRSRKVKEEVVYSTARTCPKCGRGFDEPDPRLFSFNSRHGWCPRCFGTGLFMHGFDEEQSGEEIRWNEWWEGEAKTCPACSGKRLNPEALAVKLLGRSIADETALPVHEAAAHFKSIRFSGRDAAIASGILPEIVSRLDFLAVVGLGYLTLDRAAPTLSGGEAQRVRLAAQLGSNLRGVCYILDEPTIGLHSRDNQRLLDTLRSLQQQGNTVVVVEHDEATIRHADHLIDLGPGGGVRGGSVIAQGTVGSVLRNRRSITARCLKKTTLPTRHQPRETGTAPRLVIRNASLHNIRGIDVTIPLERLVCVTGVSGSGKSTLVRDILHNNLLSKRAGKRGTVPSWHGCDSINGWKTVSRVLEVDQKPIGKTPRSCPATYVGFWDAIRKLFAKTEESLLRGYGASRFSFNVDGGRCPVCRGQGLKKIAMSFLPDVTVPCETCGGKRFTEETLAVVFKEKTIADILAMNIDKALPFFVAHPGVRRPLQLLREVGLGYLTLGQQSPTLSGGEAQRIKLVTELSRVNPGGTGGRFRKKTAGSRALFILDEPTVGLHMADIEHLMVVLHRLVDAGNSVVVIEHNLDVISRADWVIDLGPEGGSRGGRIVAEGTPQRIAAKRKKSFTGEYLRRYWEGGKRRRSDGWKTEDRRKKEGKKKKMRSGGSRSA
ncbi:MAG: excinuclease ABC subunit UvrA [Chitinispirillaceae bacterium]|nr:excinuclease ABC subunit UvrA [Chitinispirillaceae bacterium]